MNFYKLFFIFFSCLILSACASLFTDNYTTIRVFTSNGNPATAYYGRDFYGNLKSHELPADIFVDKENQADKITIKIEGNNCENRVYLKQKIEPLFWLNILGFGTYGSTTDAITGKMWTYDKLVKIKCSGYN